MIVKLKDQTIWDDFRNGHRGALDVIYKENYSSLYNYAIKFTRNTDLVEDCIHELFIELIESGNKLSATNNIKFYLLKAIRYKIINKISRLKIIDFDGISESQFNLVESIEYQLIEREEKQYVKENVIASIRKLSVKRKHSASHVC